MAFHLRLSSCMISLLWVLRDRPFSFSTAE
jgi:hypothetical protein